MPCVVITGGPGSGKTTLLGELARLGCRTVPESARAIIAERLAAGECPRPDPRAFAADILQRDLAKFERESLAPDWVFFDRAVPEALAMVQAARALPLARIRALRERCRFHHRVFVLPPWQAIYRQDAERDQTFAESIQVHRRAVGCYAALGYELHEVPAMPVADRARHVLAATLGGA